jgi:hypothetical protein
MSVPSLSRVDEENEPRDGERSGNFENVNSIAKTLDNPIKSFGGLLVNWLVATTTAVLTARMQLMLDQNFE